MAGNPGNVSTENINEVILRLLKLNPGTELDYQTYAGIIKKKLASARMTGAFLPAEEDTLLREEFKRVKNKKGRFKVKEKTTRVSTPPPPSAGPRPSGGGGGRPPKSGSIVKAQKGKITADKFAYHYYVQPVFVKDVTEKTAKVSKKSDPLENINKTLDSILKTLTDINKEDRKARERQRVSAERRQREGKEKGMESRSFEGLKKALSAVIKPFQSIFDRIINFIFYTLLGRAVMKLLDWFGDPKNQGKIQSIIRFFSDHWPTLLALYLRFGTGLGRFIGKLGGVLIKGAFKLGALAAKLAARAGLKGAGKFARFLGGPKGKAVAAGIGIAADVAVTAGTAIGIKSLAGGGEEPPTQKFAGGGAVRFPKFAGGAFANFGKMFGGSGISSGLVNGQKGKDKIPAMLTDGEFVMSTGAVQKYGVETLEAMNAAGGGTNEPKFVGGKTYAYGGGMISGADKSSDSASRKNEQALKRQKEILETTSSEKISQYNIKHGKGSYEKKLLEKLEQAYSGPDHKPNRRQQRSKLSSIKPQVNIKAPITVDPKRQSERDANKKARAEYLSIIKNMDHPDYDKAWNDPNFLDSLRAKYKSQATPTSSGGYTPYKSRFSGARDASFAKARGQSGINPYNPFTWGRPGGVFGGPRMQARTDYAASKGKYYSSSDQKTYGNYNDAMAAKKSRMTSLASQQRLNKLSAQGAGPKTGRGIRYTTEAVASERERIKRGGIMGQLGRLGTRMFGGESGRQRVAAEDKASQARVKQAGAASIGRYYSSSDGKYYKDYNAAVLAKKQRIKSGVKPLPKPKPTSKYNPAGGGMGGKRGSGSNPSKQKAPTPSPRHPKGTGTTARTQGVKR